MTRAGALMLFAAAVVAAVVIPFTWQTNVGRLVAWLIVGAGVVAMVIAVRQALDYKSTARAIVVCLVGWALASAMAVTLGLLFTRPVF